MEALDDMVRLGFTANDAEAFLMLRRSENLSSDQKATLGRLADFHDALAYSSDAEQHTSWAAPFNCNRLTVYFGGRLTPYRF